MDILKVMVVGLGSILGLTLLVVWLNDKIFRRRPTQAETEEFSRVFKERQLDPDIEGVEASLGCALPESLKNLYVNKIEIVRENFEVLIKQTDSSIKAWTVAYYSPLEKDGLDIEFPDGKGYLAFADDGCGNAYLIDPRVSAPEVLFVDHETNEVTKLGVTLAEFLAAPRKSSD